jgi:hypothetical protein
MAFRAQLVHLTFDAPQANVIINEEITSTKDLLTFTKSDLRDFSKHLLSWVIQPPYMAQQMGGKRSPTWVTHHISAFHSR